MIPVLEAREVGFAFNRRSVVLRGVSFCVFPGERLGVLGPNGAGKSTLLWRLLALYQGPGEVKLFGEPVGAAALARLGVVFQNPEDTLFMPSLEADLVLPLINRGVDKERARARAQEALRKVGLHDHAGRSAASLSLGERKRAAIAAAIVTEPELLILDEPTAELDGRAARLLADTVIAMGVTTLVTTHDLHFLARVATRVLVLVQGAIVAEGLPAEILSDTGRLEAWGLA
jgi:cobalt/nickel transport system ATP-binding protein